MSRESDDTNAMLYLLAGVGIGAIIGAAAGILLAPKAGAEVRGDISDKFLELKSKTESWIAEQRSKRAADGAVEEVGA